MLTLALLRHAKSSWDVPGIDDFDRGLAPRGTDAAPRIGAEIARIGFTPELVLCSSAVRARATLDLVRPYLKPAPRDVVYEDQLYMAGARRLLDRIAQIPAGIRTVLMVGHNPGYHELAVALTREVAPGAADLVKSKFPTCALAIYTFDTEAWSEVKPRTGRAIHFATPRGLSDD
jgi:phosphohistidine phosphatase